MKIPAVRDSKYLIEAIEYLEPDGHKLEMIPKNYTKAQQQHLKDFWFVRDRIVFLRGNLARANNRGPESHRSVEITPDYCFEIGIKQNWLCALSGQPLEFKRGGTYWGGKWCNPKSCTIDRIDSSLDYVKGNIQLITWEVNYIKQHLENDDFVNICTKVAKHNK